MGRPHELVEISSFLQASSSPSAAAIFRSLLQSCIKQRDLEAGRKVQSLLMSSALAPNTVLLNHLIRLFSTCGSLSEANQIFHSLPEPDIHSWTAIIAAHTKHGESQEAVRLYVEMQRSFVKPNEYAYVAGLKACACAADLHSGRRIHTDVINMGYDSNAYVGTALIDMYSKCGKADEALNVFTMLPKGDVVCWNAIITGLAQNGLGEQALQLFIMMKNLGIKPNHVTFVSILKACITTGDLVQGRLVHSQIIDCGLDSNVLVGSTLIDMYAKCGAVEEASKVFKNLQTKNVVTWNAMVAAYAEHGLGRRALQLLGQMQKEGMKPDSFTFVSALKACGKMEVLHEGKKIHCQVVEQGLEEDAFIGSALIDMYSKCRVLHEAWQVFYKSQKVSLVLWNSMIAAYIQHGQFEQALQLFKRMEQEGLIPDGITFVCVLRACSSIPALDQGKLIHAQIIHYGLESDCSVGSTLVDMYVKCGSLNEASEVFSKIARRDVVAWNALIVGVVQHGFDRKALDLFDAMRLEGVEPDKITMVTILKACGRLLSIDYGKLIHACIANHGLELDEVVGSNLIDMYVKCGSLEMASQVFDRLPRRNVLAWNAMIKGYAMHGHNQMSLIFFNNMQQEGTKCDGVTFVSILKICGSLAAIKKGEQIHEQIIQEGFESEIFVTNSLIDMYIKCGSLDKARKVFDDLTEKDIVSWSTIIAGYTQHKLYQDAIYLFGRMQQAGIEPNDITYVSVLKCCGSILATNQGQQIHESFIKSGSTLDFVVGNALIDMYAKCGSLTKARNVFDELPGRNVQSWNALLSGYAHHGLGQQAVQHFQTMQHEGTKPDDVTLVSVLSACSHANLLDAGCQIFYSMLEDLSKLISMQHYACMVDLLSRSGNLNDAEDFIRNIKLPADTIV
ncbi:hypothetical protein O6H91_17G039400 [Diphasiastrum complanatum]|uniref:Uncharacterized protein n=1 Tax=Diphasiastrum complanatum TaxID=34168 RepID=A0ACC2B6Z5_DIPCM|nr:hypothetical protein O6H91_17G039400 [Diphasiastrum complanatum]